MTVAIASDADNMAAFIAAWELLIRRLPGHKIAAGDGVTATLANVPLAFFSLIFLDRPLGDAAELSRALAAARAHAEACPHPSMVAFLPAWLPPGGAANLVAAKLEPATVVTGMAADTLLAPVRPLPSLDYRVANDLAAATDLAELNIHAYGLPDAQAADLATMDLWQEGSFGVVADRDGERVACTASIIVGDMIYIAMVATEPAEQGRGYAEAVMRKAIDLAAAAGGPRRIWLHATEAGRPVYARMGFETGAMIQLHAFTDIAR